MRRGFVQRIFNQLRIWFQWAAARLLIVLGGVSLVVVVGLLAVVVIRTQRPLQVVLASRQSVLVTGPLRVEFGQEVAEGFNPAIVPDVPGTWEKQRTLLGVSGVEFKPSKRFDSGQSYVLYVTGLKRAVTGAAIADFGQTFTAQIPAAVKSAAPAANAKDVPVKPRLTVALLEANHGVRELKPELVPAVPLKLVSSDDKTFVWEPSTALQQGQTYTFTLADLRLPNPEKTLLV